MIEFVVRRGMEMVTLHVVKLHPFIAENTKVACGSHGTSPQRAAEILFTSWGNSN